ncbi:hypothetical protein OG21DRAFT_1595675 [Imleria badia]|nr:hypothetical protein OG21DRAFT_1595675 [Imleria badia]
MVVALVSPPNVAAQYASGTSTAMPFPTNTLASADAQSFITSQWSVNNGHISNGATDISFVDDPFPSSGNTSSHEPVFRITYPAGSYSQGTGGAQWYSRWNTTDGSGFNLNSMLLSYEIAFDSHFNAGGPDDDGCSGGAQPIGDDCFSARLMWRKNGAGEVYAYMLTPNNLCSESNIYCNSDYGVSICRGSFGFTTGQLGFNDVLALTQSNLQLRSATNVDISGLFFSSWATPQTVHTYFRNFHLFGSPSPSNLTGAQVSASTRLVTSRGLSKLLLLTSLLAYPLL